MTDQNSATIRSRGGFTIIEMLVSVSIMFILLGIFLANYHYYGQQGQLDMTALKLASDLRRIQNFALSLKERNGIIPAGGWGIYAQENANYYRVFTDTNSNKTYDAGEQYQNELFQLPTNYKISDIRGDGASLPGNNGEIQIIYIPPNPSIWLCRANNCTTKYNQVDIIIQGQNSKTKTVTVNVYGLVEVN